MKWSRALISFKDFVNHDTTNIRLYTFDNSSYVGRVIKCNNSKLVMEILGTPVEFKVRDVLYVKDLSNITNYNNNVEVEMLDEIEMLKYRLVSMTVQMNELFRRIEDLTYNVNSLNSHLISLENNKN